MQKTTSRNEVVNRLEHQIKSGLEREQQEAANETEKPEHDTDERKRQYGEENSTERRLHTHAVVRYFELVESSEYDDGYVHNSSGDSQSQIQGFHDAPFLLLRYKVQYYIINVKYYSVLVYFFHE